MNGRLRLPIALALIGACLALPGCETLSKKECLAGDWYGIGKRDGTAGYPADRVNDHAEACLKEAGIRPDEALWERGRQDGLLVYCTAINGRERGAEGDNYRGVCSGPAEAAFMRGYTVGRQIHEVRDGLESNRHRREELEKQLSAKDITDDRRREIRGDLRRLDREDERLQRLLELAYAQPIF